MLPTRFAAPLAALGLLLAPLTASPAAPSHSRSQARSALYVANVGDASILRCDGRTGKPLAVLDRGCYPVGLALGPDGNLYATSFGTGGVVRLNPRTGKPLGTFIPRGRGGLDQPVTMAFGPDGNLYVGNWQHHDIRRFDGRTGAFLGVFVSHANFGPLAPGDVAFGPDGNLYATNNGRNSVLRFNGRTGKALGAFVKPRSGGLENPQNIAFGPNRNLFVGGPKGVLEYGKTGRFVKAFAKPGSGGLRDVGGLAFGPDGNLYVGDWRSNNILRFNGRTGAFQNVFVSAKSGLSENRYILFGPMGSGGESVAALAERAAHQRRLARRFAAQLKLRARNARAARQAAPQEEPVLLAVGTQAPDFAAQAPDGTLVHLSDFKGKPVILDFWSTWCGPCQASMPHLEKVYQQVKDQGVAVLGVCVWDQKDAYDAWVADKKGTYTFPTAFDPAGRGPNGIAKSLYNVSGIPTQYIIDKDGKVAATLVGYDESDHRLEDALTKMGLTVKTEAASAR